MKPISLITFLLTLHFTKMNIKNKIKDIAFICIIGYSVTACTNHKTATIEADKVMDINTVDGYMDEVVDTVIYLPLEMTDNSTLSRVQKYGQTTACIS